MKLETNTPDTGAQSTPESDPPKHSYTIVGATEQASSGTLSPAPVQPQFLVEDEEDWHQAGEAEACKSVLSHVVAGGAVISTYYGVECDVALFWEGGHWNPTFECHRPPAEAEAEAEAEGTPYLVTLAGLAASIHYHRTLFDEPPGFDWEHLTYRDAELLSAELGDIEELFAESLALIIHHWDAVSAVAEALFCDDELSAYQIYKICKANGVGFGEGIGEDDDHCPICGDPLPC